MTIELTNQMIFGGAVLALLAVLASIISRRLGAPLLLVFLILGMLAGEDGLGKINFNDFGLAFMLGNLALAIIIFDGGLGTRKDTFRVSLAPALSLATVGVVVTAGLTGLAARWILGLSWQDALLIGAIVGSTDAAAVFGLLRSAGLELKERTGATLEIESGTNDPMAIFLTIAFVELLAQHNRHPGLALLGEFVRQIGLGLLIGAAGGYLLTKIMKHLDLPSTLYPLLALAGGLSIFGVTNLCGGSGFLAIFIVGFMLGNAALPYGSEIHKFHDGIAWLSQIGMFLMLGLLITPSHLPPIILPATAIALVLIFIARPLAVFVALMPFHFPVREQIFIGWCGLRGAVPIILALFPLLAGLEPTSIYFELAFFVVLVSLTLQGWTIAPMAKWLKIELPPASQQLEQVSMKLSNEPDKEMTVFRVLPGSRVVGYSTTNLPLEDGAQLIGVIRKGMALLKGSATTIQREDHIIILSHHGCSSSLTRLFAVAPDSDNIKALSFFGEFTLNSGAMLSDLAEMYGFKVPAKNQDATVTQYLTHYFHGKPVVGDRVRLGAIHLVVQALEKGQITRVGIKLG